MKRPSEFCINYVIKHEGFRTNPYLDVGGKPTIGYGSTYWEDGRAVSMKDAPITKERARELYIFTLTYFWNEVDRHIGPELNESQQNALTSLAYNIGMKNFRTSTVCRLVNIDPKNPLIRDAFLMWNKVNGKIERGLVARRALEADLYFGRKAS